MRAPVAILLLLSVAASAARPKSNAAKLSEQGWAAYKAKDLAKAEQITRAAIGEAKDYSAQRIKAASLYNLGRILEDKSDKPGAITAYVESLKLRPNRTVREQLAKLDAQAAADADPLKPVPMSGPQPQPPPGQVMGELKAAGKPWLAVRYILDADEMTCHLAVKLAAGWYLDQAGFFCQEPGNLVQTVEKFAVADLVPGGSPEVVLRLTNENFERGEVELDDGEMHGATVSAGCDGDMMICGVGAAGKPSCSHFSFAKADECKGSTPAWTWELKPSFGSDGQVDVQCSGKPSADAKAIMGKRAFKWP